MELILSAVGKIYRVYIYIYIYIYIILESAPTEEVRYRYGTNLVLKTRNRFKNLVNTQLFTLHLGQMP